MENNSYNNWWMPFDMNKMGLLFEHCSDLIFKHYNLYIDIPLFFENFLNSKLRVAIDNHHPFYSTRSNEENIQTFFDLEYDNKIPKNMISNYNQKNDFRENELYWMGYFFIYCLYKKEDIKTSSELLKILDFKKLKLLYPTFHQMDNANCFERIFK